MAAQDVELAEALWARSRDFENRGDYYNALLDVSAAHRLLVLSNDSRAGEVHVQWARIYELYTQGGSEQREAHSRSVSRLEELLKQVEGRRKK
jgi:hypothetical protein